MNHPRLSTELLDTAVAGRNLVGVNLRDNLADGPRLVVSLRHFG